MSVKIGIFVMVQNATRINHAMVSPDIQPELMSSAWTVRQDGVPSHAAATELLLQAEKWKRTK